MAARGGRGGGGGGGGANMGGGRGRGGGQWRQVSGRGSPAPSPTGQGQQQGQQQAQHQPRTAKAGSQGGSNGAGNGLQGAEGKASDAAGQDVLGRLRQHMGNRITISLRAGARLTGRLASLSDAKPGSAASTAPSPASAADTPSTLVTLEDVVETQRKGAGGSESSGGSMPQLSVGLGQIVGVEVARSEPAKSASASGSAGSGQSQAAFRTDKDISNGRAPRERELQPWMPDGEALPPPSASGSGAVGHISARRDQETFGDLSSGPVTGWDQFATNEKLFGARTDFDENLYTTKVNRDKAGFRAREQEAERLAREIMNSDTSNPHVVEERGKDVSGMDEEDKFSGVQRSPNAYVPPGARKGGPPVPSPAQAKVLVEPTVAPPAATTPAAAAAPAVAAKVTPAAAEAGIAPTASGAAADAERAATAANLPSARKTDKPETPVIRHDVQLQIREFVGTERERLDKKKMAMQRIERERNLSELKRFGKDFQVKLPFPEELLPIIASTPEKQRAIQEKIKAAQSNGNAQQSASQAASPSTPTASSKAARTSARMQIQEIPPFGGKKPPTLEIPPTAGLSVPQPPAQPSPGSEAARAAALAPPKLNPGASSFVFKPNAAAPQFTPGGNAKSPEAGGPAGLPAVPSAIMAVSPSQATRILTSPRTQAKLPETKAAPDAVASFFPPTAIKRITNVNVRDDFNPFKLKVPDPKSVSPAWPFSGKRLAIQPMPGMSAVFGVASSAGEEDSGMFANGQAMQGLALSPSPAPNYPYPPANMPMRYPVQMGPHGQMPPMAMQSGPSAPYPPFAGGPPYMGGPMYPNLNMQPFMNPGQGGPPPSAAMGGMRPAAPMMYQRQAPPSPHQGSPYAGQVNQVSQVSPAAQ